MLIPDFLSARSNHVILPVSRAQAGYGHQTPPAPISLTASIGVSMKNVVSISTVISIYRSIASHQAGARVVNLKSIQQTTSPAAANANTRSSTPTNLDAFVTTQKHEAEPMFALMLISNAVTAIVLGGAHMMQKMTSIK